MIIMGLTGCIASGKSTIANYFRRHHHPVFDADKAVHQLMGPYGDAVDAICATFGAVGDKASGIDRQKLGQYIFANPQERRALEALIHPLVAAKREQFIKLMRAHGKRAVILDVPLLFEADIDVMCDITMTAYAPLPLIKKRALRRAGMTAEKLEQILSAQMPQNEKNKRADFVITTALGHNHMTRQLNRLLSRYALKTDFSKKAHYG